MERRDGPWFSFVVLVLLKLERDGSLIVVTVVVFVEVALVGKMVWSVRNQVEKRLGPCVMSD
jgi:hypothetical protein